jgi:HTH-type transcriptional repressor of NAD biosynthesis genes
VSASAFVVDGPARSAARGIRSVAVMGGESSGKSTLIAALVARYDEPAVAEYGRTLWEEQGGHTSYDDLLRIAVRHVADEEAAMARAKRMVFVDTTPLTTLWYAIDWHQRADPALVALSWRRYDLTLVCSPDFAFVQDGSRSPEDFRSRHDRWLRATLAARGVTFHDVRGPVEARTAHVAELIGPTERDA